MSCQPACGLGGSGQDPVGSSWWSGGSGLGGQWMGAVRALGGVASDLEGAVHGLEGAASGLGEWLAKSSGGMERRAAPVLRVGLAEQ